MSTTPFAVAIIGAGYMGRMHADQYLQLDGVEVVGVYDPDQAAADELARRCGARTAGSLDEVLARSHLDAVSICTPDAHHRESAVKAALAGKHILIEKPLATSLEDAHAIVDAANAAGVVLAVGFVNRFLDMYLRAEEAVARGAVGRIMTVTARRLNIQAAAQRVARRDNVVDFLAVHDIDVLHWLCGQITSVTAVAETFVFEGPDVQPDTSLLLLRFASGAVGTLHVAWSVPDTAPFRARAGIELIGTEGILTVDSFDDRVGLFNGEGSRFLLDWKVAGAFFDQVRSFVEAARIGSVPRATGLDGLRALEVVEAAKRSLAAGGAPALVTPAAVG